MGAGELAIEPARRQSCDGMIVATCLDSAFLELGGVMLASLAANGGRDCKAVYVFANGLSGEQDGMLRQCYPCANLVIQPINAQLRRRICGLSTTEHFSSTIYFRLLIPELLQEEAGRLLYLDADIVVNRSIAALEEFNLEGFPVAAAEGVLPDRHAKWNKRIGNPAETPYLNSGVLLMNLARWRELHLTEATMDYLARNHRRLKFPDQDALNAVMKGSWRPLDSTWNFYETSGRPYLAPTAAYLDAHIIHFAGPIKPNCADCVHPAKDVFLAYREQTPWRGKPLLTITRAPPKKRKVRLVGRMRQMLTRMLHDPARSKSELK